ncbi:hypothetical protein H8S90_00355 [Olivibacter sp. SDN3]|uniref:hypothetical protein n=1 Tax=Olivibacter sp. SDN3 TaxID=2764720 RepID=UPI001651466D|nr:hypothetical protein [Olivibacter sp. SDN3]QNL50129.1 hypothetical protein H8S90_00355 [Olivibacter sp. SDN3]
MKKESKTPAYEPKDSEQETKSSNKAVKTKKDKTYKKESAILGNPAKKRMFSEQPPTKHNTRN